MASSTRAGEDVHMPDHAGARSNIRPRSVHLELNIDEPFLRLIEFMRARLADTAAAGNPGSGLEVKDGRRKPTRMAVRAVQLGERKVTRTDGVDIVVKFLYKKPQKIVFQFCINGEEYTKVNILWSNIKVIHACFNDSRYDSMEIQVKSSSELYCAKRHLPWRYLEWQRCEDYPPRISNPFSRTFNLEFEKGTLDRSYGKLLYTDPSVYLLRFFPSGKQQEESQATNNAQQVLTQQNSAMPPCAEAAIPGTVMISSTNTGTNHAAHEHGGIQLYDLPGTISAAYGIQFMPEMGQFQMNHHTI